MATIKIPKKTLTDLGLPYSGPIISNEIADHTRWSVHHSIIFEHLGKFYRTWYSVGATEMQDESAWECETEIECTEVYEVEKIIKVWEPVDAA